MRYRKHIIFSLLLSVSILGGCSVPSAQTTQLATDQTPKDEIQSIVTKEPASPTNTATLVATPMATATPQGLPEGERMAYLEGSQLVIVHLRSSSTLWVSDGYQQLQGWSPSGETLLAVREDGKNVIVGVNGEIITTIEDLSQPAFWATPNEFDDTNDWLYLKRTARSICFPSHRCKPSRSWNPAAWGQMAWPTCAGVPTASGLQPPAWRSCKTRSVSNAAILLRSSTTAPACKVWGWVAMVDQPAEISIRHISRC